MCFPRQYGFRDERRGYMGYLQKAQVDQYEIRLNDEPVLYKIGLSPSPLPHMDYELAATPAQSMRFYEEMQQRKAQLQARGLIA